MSNEHEPRLCRCGARIWNDNGLCWNCLHVQMILVRPAWVELDRAWGVDRDSTPMNLPPQLRTRRGKRPPKIKEFDEELDDA